MACTVIRLLIMGGMMAGFVIMMKCLSGSCEIAAHATERLLILKLAVDS